VAGLIIAVEGLPGTGKTSLCKVVAQELGVQYTKEPYTRGDWGGHRDLLYNPNHSQRTRAFLMMAQRSSHLEEFEAIPRAHFEPVIFDRYILTTVGHQAESLGDAHMLYKYQTMVGFRKPDLQVYLTAPRDVRLSRMEDRGENDELDEMNTESLEEHFHHGLKLMVEDGVPVTIIDTSKSSFEQCLNMLLSDIKEIVDGNRDIDTVNHSNRSDTGRSLPLA